MVVVLFVLLRKLDSSHFASKIFNRDTFPNGTYKLVEFFKDNAAMSTIPGNQVEMSKDTPSAGSLKERLARNYPRFHYSFPKICYYLLPQATRTSLIVKLPLVPNNISASISMRKHLKSISAADLSNRYKIR